MSVDRSTFLTERSLAASAGLDQMSAAQVIALMNQQDACAVRAVEAVQSDVVRAVELIVDKLRIAGRLIYVGAGSSGRLGVLDASECPPTFRSDPSQVLGIIAGGNDAMFRAKEGAEDDADAGAEAMRSQEVSASDVVCGIAAGGTTPFVHGALAHAKSVGAATIFLTCVQRYDAEPFYDITIRPLVGPEVLTGSTRLKAGTATKLVLNQLTTTTFVRLGKCYENLMVDLRCSNAKLVARGTQTIARVCHINAAQAADLLQRAGGHVKSAIVMHVRQCDLAAAGELLRIADGHLRRVISA